ncbi:hypothetical protein JCM8097_007092 [Rhodosporidiobolus ruineniae]
MSSSAPQTDATVKQPLTPAPNTSAVQESAGASDTEAQYEELVRRVAEHEREKDLVRLSPPGIAAESSLLELLSALTYPARPPPSERITLEDAYFRGPHDVVETEPQAHLIPLLENSAGAPLGMLLVSDLEELQAKAVLDYLVSEYCDPAVLASSVKVFSKSNSPAVELLHDLLHTISLSSRNSTSVAGMAKRYAEQAHRSDINIRAGLLQLLGAMRRAERPEILTTWSPEQVEGLLVGDGTLRQLVKGASKTRSLYFELSEAISSEYTLEGTENESSSLLDLPSKYLEPMSIKGYIRLDELDMPRDQLSGAGGGHRFILAKHLHALKHVKNARLLNGCLYTDLEELRVQLLPLHRVNSYPPLSQPQDPYLVLLSHSTKTDEPQKLLPDLACYFPQEAILRSLVDSPSLSEKLRRAEEQLGSLEVSLDPHPYDSLFRTADAEDSAGNDSLPSGEQLAAST